MDMVCEALEAGEEKAAKNRQINANSGERKENDGNDNGSENENNL